MVDLGKTTAVITSSSVATKVYMYEMMNQLYIQMLSSFPLDSTATLIVSQMRNAGWQFVTPYTIKMIVIRGNRYQHVYSFITL